MKVGQPLSLVAIAGDPDNLPPVATANPSPGVKKSSPSGGGQPPSGAPANSPAVMYRPPSQCRRLGGPRPAFVVDRLRGKADEQSKFTPDQMKTWNDTRRTATRCGRPRPQIPVPPADGKWTADAVFSEPGTYVLRAVASDGSLFTYDNVTVTVSP